MQVLKALKRGVLKLFLLLLAVYFFLFVWMYNHYDNKTKITKQQTISYCYNKILNITLSELNRLAVKKHIDLQSKDTFIEIDLGSINICQQNKFLRCNLLKLIALVNSYIPEYINYKIALNKKDIYANTKIQDYEIEKIYVINPQIHLTTSLSIDPIYWQNKSFTIKKTFYILSLTAIIGLLLFYVLSRFILKHSNKLYQLYYTSTHQVVVEQLKVEHQQQLKQNEAWLMEKIWNSNFNRQKDIAVNYLFAHAANQIAYGKQDKPNNLMDQMPCSIILYQPDCQERVDIHKLIHIFTDRFSSESDNIVINLSSSLRTVYFSSQAALYQIVYSLISYLLFLLKQLPNTDHYHINLSISMIEQRLKLSFTYNGTPVHSKEELFNRSDQYFKTHANPFLLNAHQIFNTLSSHGFNCTVSSSTYNIIEITEEALKYKSNKNNIFSISSNQKP